MDDKLIKFKPKVVGSKMLNLRCCFFSQFQKTWLEGKREDGATLPLPQDRVKKFIFACARTTFFHTKKYKVAYWELKLLTNNFLTAW